jgi:hypothetical protein
VDPVSLVTTTNSNDTIRITFNTNNTANANLLVPDAHTAAIGVGTNITDSAGNSANTAASAVTIADVNNAPTGSVTIGGTPTEDQVLTAANTLADEDGLGVITYQWQSDGVDIAGATSSTYALTQTDVGTTITVDAGYTDAEGTAESVSSNPVTVAESPGANAGLAQFLTDSAAPETTPLEAALSPSVADGPEDADDRAEESSTEETREAESEEQTESGALAGEQRLLTQTMGTFNGPMFTYTPPVSVHVSFSIDVALESGEVVHAQVSNDQDYSDTPVITAVDTEEAAFERLRQMFSTTSEVDFWLGSEGFVSGIDHLQSEVLEESQLNKLVVGSGFAVSSGLSVGYVLWIARSGVLLSSVLSTMPAWRFVDPFPVLSRATEVTRESKEEDVESLESIASNSTGDDDAEQDAESEEESDGKPDV